MNNFFSVCRHTSYLSGVLVLALGIALITSSQAHAHRMKVFAWVDGQTVEGEVYFSGGQKANDATIEILVDQAVIATTKSNKEGGFRFEDLAGLDYVIRADAGQGHIVSYTVSASEFASDDLALPAQSQVDGTAVTAAPQSSTAPHSSAAVLTPAQLERAIAKAIQPLREQIDQYEAKVRMHDILGGVGYIFGVFGLVIWFRTRRK